MSPRNAKRIVLITGANRGFGLLLAEALRANHIAVNSMCPGEGAHGHGWAERDSFRGRGG